MVREEKENKKKVFIRWQLNSLTSVKFIRPHQIVIEMNLFATKFDHHHWMANKMHLVITIKFGHHCQMETRKGRIWQTPFCLFWSPQGWTILKNGHHPIVTISQMVTKVF
jgi:hypothetical protein